MPPSCPSGARSARIPSRRGPPQLRGFVCGGAVYLREGTHRIRAAHRLGIVPTIISIPWWRSRASLNRAEFAAIERGLDFTHVNIER